MSFRSFRSRRICRALSAAAIILLVAKLLELYAIAADSVHFIVLAGDRLIDAQKRLKANDAALGPALTRLTRDAGRALTAASVAVTDKNFLPPSGDKHDYMSIAPYWWPNPRTPDGLPFVRRDGEVNPERDRISDRQPLEKTIQAVKTLSLAYFFSGREEYAEDAARLLRVWFLDPSTKMNPHLKYAQSVPGRNVGRAAGIIETHDLAELIDFVSMLNDSKPWTAREREQWQDWIKQYARWLTESTQGKTEAKAKNNHGTWYDVQIAAFGISMGQDELAKKILRQFAAKRISAQIESDGRQTYELARTRSWDYAVFNLEGLFDAASIADKLGIDLWHYRSSDGRGIRRALDWLVPFATGETRWPYQQIAPLVPKKLAPLLRRAALAYHEPAYEHALVKLPGIDSDNRWQLLYPKID